MLKRTSIRGKKTGVKRRLLPSVMALSFIMTMFIVPVVAANDIGVLDEQSDEAILIEQKSEYQMALESTQQMQSVNNINSASDILTPIEEFKEAFDARAEMDVDILEGMGYNETEIHVLKGYLNGDYTFEEAAERASAVLSVYLTCSPHTAKLYTVSYNWVWDKTPSGLGEDAMALGLVGIDANSSYFATVRQSSSARITYKYIDGSFYKNETPATDVKANTISVEFDSYKQDNLGSSWVWAESGRVTFSISPAVSGDREFAAVRAMAAYGHSSGTSTRINVSISVSLASGDIDVSFDVVGVTGSVSTLGKRQIVFYNDGSSHVEL